MGSYGISPPVAVASNQKGLWLAYRPGTYVVEVNLAQGTGAQWAGPFPCIGPATTIGPAFVGWSGGAILGWLDTKNNVRVGNVNPEAPFAKQLTSMSSSTTPALAVSESQDVLYCVGLASGGNTLWFAQTPLPIPPGTSANFAVTALPWAITTTIPPTMAVSNGTIFVMFQSSSGDQTIFVTYSGDNGNTWNLTQLAPAITTSRSPALTVMNGKLYAVFRSSGDSTLFITSSATPTVGASWDLHQLPPAITTASTPAVTVWNNTIYVLYQSSGDASVWQVSSSDGVTWPQLVVLPPAITVGNEWPPPFAPGIPTPPG